jgi:hypothetical protein
MTKSDYHNLYLYWWDNRTPDEMVLHYKILEYDDKYFDDMRLDPVSIVKEYLVFSYDGCGDEDSFDMNMGLEANYYRYFLKKFDNYTGIHDSEERTITIDPRFIEDKAVILHEMIHAHENIVNAEYPFIRDILLLTLYKFLNEKINDLEDRIKAHSHVIPGANIFKLGGNHDVLFYLKSLDLDLRCGYRLGTICGYGREEY